MHKQWWWCHGHKTWLSDNWKSVHDVVRWVALHAVPYARNSLCSKNIQKSLQSGMPGSVPTVKHGEICDGFHSNMLVQYSVGSITILYGHITAREHMDRPDNQVHPMIQTLFLNDTVISQYTVLVICIILQKCYPLITFFIYSYNLCILNSGHWRVGKLHSAFLLPHFSHNTFD
jgi:hypothetical protein